MKKLILESEGILYRNPLPGHKAECAYLPNVISVSATELLCIFRLGQAFYSVDGKLAKSRSTDGGQTWVREGWVWDSKLDEKPYSYSAPHTTRLKDGTLLLVAKRFDGSDPERLMFNPTTGGLNPCESVLFRSNDNGRTWSRPTVIDLPGNGVGDTPSSVIELNSGRLFLACELWKEWNDTSPLHIKGLALFSDDGGKTWGNRSYFRSASDPKKMYSHSRYTKMLDGRIFALQWTQEIGTGKDYNLHFTVSDTAGMTWTDPQPTGLEGQTSWAADLGSGIIAAAYTQRKGMNPGIYVTFSDNEGKSWNTDNPLMVWDAVGQEYLGVSHKPSYPASHDNIAFGKPYLVRLPDGLLLCAWWCTQACVTHARYAKLRLE